MKKIPLTQGKFALVDDEDFEKLSKFKWYANKLHNSFYAMRHSKEDNRKFILMHREILKTPNKKVTDHIDQNGLNNQRSNLRVATPSQNQHNKGGYKNNTSGLKGVMWHKRDKKWFARTKLNGKNIYLGYYTSKELAHEAYVAGCKKYHGKFTPLKALQGERGE